MQRKRSMEENLLPGSTSKMATTTTITFVLLISTFAASCGSIAYGFAVGYSSPAEGGIMDDLGLSLADRNANEFNHMNTCKLVLTPHYLVFLSSDIILKYSAFSSTLTLGGAIGALISGRVAESVGRRVVCFLLFFDTCWIPKYCARYISFELRI
ncbi:hypothetical protein HAX54_028145 [Datura stramonium]|uniref:Major facilitator superfamily (MFS) profile domain-containing protein n=1 Tax=Datura stramonium TaxID=4076 RepID=A0ABS8V5M5_DATST|nr:hypothetical protein [Datura stramonium]